jgi:hypothetical protein
MGMPIFFVPPQGCSIKIEEVPLPLMEAAEESFRYLKGESIIEDYVSKACSSCHMTSTG